MSREISETDCQLLTHSNYTVTGVATVLQIKPNFLMSSVFYLENAHLYYKGSVHFLSFLPFIIFWVSVKHLWATAITGDTISGITVACFLHTFLHSLTHLYTLFSQRLNLKLNCECSRNQVTRQHLRTCNSRYLFGTHELKCCLSNFCQERKIKKKLAGN